MVKIQSPVCNELERTKAITRSKSQLSVEERKKLKKLGQTIRAEREKQNLTLYGVEDRGYSFYQHWQAVEKGEKNVTFTTLLSMCEILRKHPSELLKDI